MIGKYLLLHFVARSVAKRCVLFTFFESFDLSGSSSWKHSGSTRPRRQLPESLQIWKVWR